MGRGRGVAAAVALAALGLGTAAGARVARPRVARTAHVATKAAPAAAVAYVVMDADTGTVLAEKDAHKRWPPASMTKMMTVLLAMERARDGSLKLDEPVRTSAWASRIGGSQVFLAENETFPLGEMLKAVMIASANDAAVAVAEHLAGSSSAFVDLMNARAKALGLTDTTYQSPHGLPPGAGQTADLSSAHDLAVLGREIMRFPEVMQWAGTPSAGFRNDTLQMSNTNHLVRGMFPGATGLKTGYYREAGFSVTATALRNDLHLIAVVLGVERKQDCFREAARLMNENFAAYRMVAPARRGAAVGEVAVAGGSGETVKAIALDDLRVLVKRADDKGVAVETRIPRLVQAPVHQRQPLGEVVVRRGDQELGRVPVVADRDVVATGWLSWLWNRGLSPSGTATR
jgi:D-alanyl-D-alanine carboxypeptidase (penicillin-binding protein 5/6)